MFTTRPLVHAIHVVTWATALSALSAPPAFAQDEEIEEVVVTGSRIQREDLTANSPIEIIGQDEIRVANTTNLEEFLRERPQFTQALGASTNNGNPGAATVDLRNLGEERTLVLVNGKRFTPFDYYGAVDLSMIPPSLISRVEVITGGASAVYGTDAIAGVVNFIMDDQFEGIEVDVSAFQTSEGDAKRQDYSVTLGRNFADERGNIVLNVGYTDQDELFQEERDFGFEALSAEDLSPFGSATNAEGSVLYTPFEGDPDGGAAQFDADGNVVPLTSSFNFNPFNLFQTPQKKTTGTLLGHFDFTDAVTAYTRISYAKNEVDTIIAPTGTFFFPFTLNYATNPFLGPDAVARFAAVDAAEEGEGAGDGLVDINLGRRLVELGTRDSIFENETLQYVFGLNGEFSEAMQWEVFAQYGETDRSQNFVNDASFERTQEALLAELSGGEVVCSSGNPACAPANLFGPGNLSPEAASYIRIDLEEVNETEQLVFGGSISGATGFTLPTADTDISYALGFEIRQDDGTAEPDAAYASGDAMGFGSSSPVEAEIDIEEIFAEALVPVLEPVTLELGARYSWYENSATFAGEPEASNDFTNTSYKVGLDWQIIEDLRARAMFQRAVRAPNLAEIGLPRTPSIGDLDVDPCEGDNPIGNPELEALCLATGVPAANLGSVTSIISGQIGNFLGGNPELDPEEADTVTVGLVYTPSALPGLELSLDYYDITIEDVITQLSEQEIVTGCYTSADPNSDFCQRIVRSPTTGGLNAGSTVGVDVSLLNSAEETAKGWDLNARYGFELGDMGSLTLGLVATYTAEHEFQSAPGSVKYDCAGLVGTTCVRPDPEWRWTQTTTWEMGGLRLDLTWRYLDELTQDSIELGGSTAADWAEPVIDDYSYFDLSGRYALNDNWTIRAGVDNVLDEEPPVVGTDYGGTAENSGNTYPSTYDVLGRAYFVGVNVSF
ncbi:TonB-dependent receptor [Gilvimarinus sp. F26214L]|uniref:TonB-dependent receptor n=1 Tax=Gilvimarinus sp. DZF01 TaxID=3461371 RepID=UPI0040462CBD